MSGSEITAVLLPEGEFTREQAVAVAAQDSNVAMEDDQRMHFRLGVCESAGCFSWRNWNFEAGGGAMMNRYIESYGLVKQQ